MRKAASEKDQGDHEAAIHLYERVLDVTPRMAKAHLDLALLLHDSKKDYNGAIYHYKRYLDLRPGSEKRTMIENRIRLAQQLYAVSILGRDRRRLPVPSALEPKDETPSSGETRDGDAAKIAALERENNALKKTAKELKSDVSRLNTALEEQAKQLHEREGELARERSARASRIGRGSSATGAGSGVSPEVAVGRKEPKPRSARKYQVKRGDSLSSIAKQVYDNEAKWRDIYRANRKSLGEASRLRVGQVLVIP